MGTPNFHGTVLLRCLNVCKCPTFKSLPLIAAFMPLGAQWTTLHYALHYEGDTTMIVKKLMKKKSKVIYIVTLVEK